MTRPEPGGQAPRAEAASPSLTGEEAGRHELLHVVGRGGMGVVWAARDPGGREVAIKVLRVEKPLASVARLRREAAAMRRVAHPAVCALEKVVSLEDGSIGLVMELLVGETLQARLDREGSLSLEDTAQILTPVIEAVRAAHASGVVHRDLKPSNIFVRTDGGVRVLDFGIAKILDVGTHDADEDGGGGDLTTSNTLIGSPAYMAPEQIFGEPDVDERVDVWALGLVLYRSISGVLPTDPQGEGVGRVLKLILKEPIRPVGLVASTVPPELAAQVDAMLTREREQRPSRLDAVLEALAASRQATAPIEGPIEGPIEASAASAMATPPVVEADETPGAATPHAPSRRLLPTAALVAAAAAVGWLALGAPPAPTGLDHASLEPSGAASARAPVEPAVRLEDWAGTAPQGEPDEGETRDEPRSEKGASAAEARPAETRAAKATIAQARHSTAAGAAARPAPGGTAARPPGATTSAHGGTGTVATGATSTAAKSTAETAPARDPLEDAR